MRPVLLAALLLAAPASAAQAPGSSLGSEAAELLIVSGAGVGGSVLFLGVSAASGNLTPGVLSPLAAGVFAYAASEAVDMDGTLVHATQGALLGAGLAALLAVSTDNVPARYVYWATLPAVGAALNLRIGGPILILPPTGALAPGWSLRVGL